MICSNPGCNNLVGKTLRGKWKLHCSLACRGQHNSLVGSEKRKKTCLERFGATSNLATTDHREKTKAVLLEKYGVEHQMHLESVKAQVRITNLENYGVDNPSKSDSVKEKKKLTSLMNHGADHPLRAPEVQENRRKRSIIRHGVDHYSKTEEYKQQYSNTCLERYGVDNASKSDIVKTRIKSTWKKKYGNNFHPSQQHISTDSLNKLQDKNWLSENKDMSATYLAELLDVSYHTIIYAYNKHNIDRKSMMSLGHADLRDFIVNECQCTELIVNSRSVLGGKELDIYMPTQRLAIEFDGVFWHSELAGRSHDYHTEKTDACNQQGIRLIHILDIEWNNKKDIVKSRISNLLGLSRKVHARKCTVKEIDATEYTDFFNRTHIQGSAWASVAYGLFHDNELVAVMSFSKPRFNKSAEWELLRYSSKLGITVVGGASKLFMHFVRINKPTSIVSYADRRWNTGAVYQSLGFTFKKNSSPNYWYTKDYKSLMSRMKFQKHKLEKILPAFDPALSEWENMQVNGYDRYWDCGNSVWIWTAPE